VKYSSYSIAPEFNRIHTIVWDFFGEDKKTDIWFETPNPLLGDISPAQMLMLGRGEKLLKIVQNWMEGNMP
jgi:uncharacterized protein (DUF2384 family)